MCRCSWFGSELEKGKKFGYDHFKPSIGHEELGRGDAPG